MHPIPPKQPSHACAAESTDPWKSIISTSKNVPNAATAAHTRAALRRRLQPLYTEKHMVSCPGFLPKATPCNIRTAITMHFAAASIHPCSHYIAICNHRFENTLQLGTHDEPRIAKHHQGTNHTPKRTDRNRRTHELPSVAACSHFTRKHTWFRAPASSPKQTPCNIHAAITMRFAAPGGKPASIHAHGNRTWQQSCSHSTAISNHRFQNTL